MAHVADHLSVSALEQQYRSCTDVTAARPPEPNKASQCGTSHSSLYLYLSCPRFLWTPYCSEKLEDRQHGR